MRIEISENGHIEQLELHTLLEQAPVRLELAERVPGAAGQAFDLMAWYQVWTKETKPPTRLYVEATDEFTATIPWAELEQAAFLYEQNGMPLQKGFPLRLYVPDGSSACLNVKSVVRIKFMHEPDPDGKAVYGFQNQVKPDQLRKKL